MSIWLIDRSDKHSVAMLKTYRSCISTSQVRLAEQPIIGSRKNHFVFSEKTGSYATLVLGQNYNNVGICFMRFTVTLFVTMVGVMAVSTKPA